MIFQDPLDDINKDMKLNEKILNNIRFADDTVILANNVEDLQFLEYKEAEVSATYGLRINFKKTMKIGKRPLDNLALTNLSEKYSNYL